MRWPYCSMFLGFALGTSACLAQTREHPIAAGDKPIIIDEDSNVCVSVHVDQRIWPRPFDDETARNLSGSLASELRRPYLAMGGSYAVHNSNPAERFVTNWHGTMPTCQDRDTDIWIDVQYQPRADGKPFIFEYRITKGQVQREGRVDVNVAEEIRAGHMRGYDQRRTDEVIISQDIPQRATMLFDLLEDPGN
jgi:hypothetical protein